MLSPYVINGCLQTKSPAHSKPGKTRSIPPACDNPSQDQPAPCLQQIMSQASGRPSLYCPSAVTWLVSLISHVLSSLHVSAKRVCEVPPSPAPSLALTCIVSARPGSLARDARERVLGRAVTLNKAIICDPGEGKGRGGDSLVFLVTQLRLEPGIPRRYSHKGAWPQGADRDISPGLS